MPYIADDSLHDILTHQQVVKMKFHTFFGREEKNKTVGLSGLLQGGSKILPKFDDSSNFSK